MTVLSRVHLRLWLSRRKRIWKGLAPCLLWEPRTCKNSGSAALRAAQTQATAWWHLLVACHSGAASIHLTSFVKVSNLWWHCPKPMSLDKNYFFCQESHWAAGKFHLSLIFQCLVHTWEQILLSEVKMKSPWAMVLIIVLMTMITHINEAPVSQALYVCTYLINIMPQVLLYCPFYTWGTERSPNLPEGRGGIWTQAVRF